MAGCVKHVWENTIFFFFLESRFLCLMAIRNATLAENWHVIIKGMQSLIVVAFSCNKIFFLLVPSLAFVLDVLCNI